LTITGIKLADIRLGKFEDSEVLIYMMDPTKPDSAYLISAGYLAGAVDKGGEKFELNFFSLEQRLNDNIGVTVTERCPYKLGEKRCTVAARTGNGQVSALGGNPRNTITVQMSTSISGGTAPNFWAFGIFQVLTTSTNLAGYTSEVLRSAYLGANTYEIYLLNELPEVLQLGDGVRLIEGCENTVTACADRNNIINFGGFPDLPGIDKLLTSA
jgi:uncharacterized phage protein (TIGR02218 family)